MTAPPTLVLSEDDERTIVDQRVPAAQPSPEPHSRRSKRVSGRLAASLRNRWRSLLAGVAGGGLCLSVTIVALHQRRLSERLQRTIDVMQTAAQSVHPVETTPTLGSQETPPSMSRDPVVPVVGAEAASRDDLEVEAATLVVANDYRAALESYRVLAARFPGERSFSDIVTILRAKVACHGKRGVEALSCD